MFGVHGIYPLHFFNPTESILYISFIPTESIRYTSFIPTESICYTSLILTESIPYTSFNESNITDRNPVGSNDYIHCTYMQ